MDIITVNRTYWPIAYHDIGTTELELLLLLAKLCTAYVVQQKGYQPDMGYPSHFPRRRRHASKEQ